MSVSSPAVTAATKTSLHIKRRDNCCGLRWSFWSSVCSSLCGVGRLSACEHSRHLESIGRQPVCSPLGKRMDNEHNVFRSMPICFCFLVHAVSCRCCLKKGPTSMRPIPLEELHFTKLPTSMITPKLRRYIYPFASVLLSTVLLIAVA